MNLEQIVAFFDTALGKQLIQHHQTVRREQPFSMLIEAEEPFKIIQKRHKMIY